MSYLFVPSGLGDSCTVDATGARVCSSAPATAPLISSGAGWGRSFSAGGGRSRGGRQSSRHRRSSQAQGCPWCASAAATPQPIPAPITSVYSDLPGYGGRVAMNLMGLGAIIARNTLARRTWTPSNTPASVATPVVVNAPAASQQQYQQGRGQRQGQRYGMNNRRGQAYGTSNYAPWNTSPTCSDPTSQYYNPQDPSCVTGNNPICTNPTYPGYNPNDPSCAAINQAALLAAGNTTALTTTGATTTATTTDYSSYLLLGGGLLLVLMLFKK